MIFHSKWRLEVTKSLHNWKNRYRITGASQGNGTFDPVAVGTVHNIDGLPQWEIIGEHQKHGENTWNPSKMKLLTRTQNGAELTYVFGSEDPLPKEDYEDIQWEGVFKGRMFEIPYRPYAVKMTDMVQMPDGIFDTILGSYYMGVRVRNVWAEPFTASHTLDITNQCRSILAAQGISIIDSWSSQELQLLGQKQVGRGISLEGLKPGAYKTVYFKINVSAARPRKYDIEFIHIDINGTPDPWNPKRLIKKKIFVSSSYMDDATGEMVCELKEGTIRMKFREVAYDMKGARKARKKCKCRQEGYGKKQTMDELRKELQKLLEEGKIDICELKDILLKLLGPDWEKCCDPTEVRAGKYCIKPFFLFPTKYEFTIEPKPPFAGQYGPIPFDDPWWKVALLILAAILAIAGALTEGSDLAYHDEDLIIGTLSRFQGDDIDAALCLLDTDRAMNLREVIDARNDEPNLVPVIALDGVVALTAPIMTRAELEALLLTGNPDDVRVFKSGARTGLTFGIVNSTTSAGHPEVNWGLGQIEIEIDTDPAFGNGMGVSDSGDSGSCWVHHATMKPVGLNHSGDANGTTFAVASFLEDVQNILNVTF